MHVADFYPETIPPHIMEHHQNITYCADIFYVNGLTFLHTISRKLLFRTVQYIPNRTKETIQEGIDLVTNLYNSRGFKVIAIHADYEFTPLKERVRPVDLNCTAANEHVPEIERSVHTIKDRNRSTIQGLPFKRFPRTLLKEIIKFSNNWINAFPLKTGVSNKLSP